MVNDDPFKDVAVISSYTRADAIADGTFVDLMQDVELAATIREAGFAVPICATPALLAECIELNDRSHAYESRTARLWDILFVLRHSLPKGFTGPNEWFFRVSVSGELKSLLADFTYDDDGKPAITLCYASER
jgi:hypothetical protein